MQTAKEIKVWDLFVRSFHWTLVAAFAISLVTEGKPRWLHVNSGYLIAVLSVLRMLYGFIGPRHARFSDFVKGPGEILRHLRDVARFRAKPYLGHDPAGGAMIVALLVFLSLTTLSGMLLYGAKDMAGPFAALSADTVMEALSPARTAFADGRREKGEHRLKSKEKEEDEWMEEVHETLAYTTMSLSIIHICGVLLVSFQTRENLVLGMITGRKRNVRGS